MKVAECAFPGPLRDKLLAAIPGGDMTSTSGLLVEYEHFGEEVPTVGERELLVDSDERGVAVIETTGVRPHDGRRLARRTRGVLAQREDAVRPRRPGFHRE